MSKIPAPLLTLVAGILITLVSLWVGQHNGLLPEQASEQAPLVDNLFNVMVTIATALFIVVEGTIVYFAVRFRRKRGEEGDGLPIEGNLPLEAFWTAIPAIIVIGLGIYSVDVFQEIGGFTPGEHGAIAHHHGAAVVAQAPASEAIAGDVPALIDNSALAANYGLGAPASETADPELVVKVTAMQYAWLFNYPDLGITTGELRAPMGKAVRLEMTAQDVIHSFWIPQFRIKQDVFPGQTTSLRFVATKTGSFPVVCTELCGSYHGGMRAEAIIQSPEEYEAWVAANLPAQEAKTEEIALSPADLSDSQFLAPYADEMGINASALAQVHTGHAVH